MSIGISGVGSYIPEVKSSNKDFESHTFLNSEGEPFNYSNTTIIEKFKAITGIEERRYAKKDINTSDLGYYAAKKAIEDSGCDPEELDYIIFAHNFGNISFGQTQGDTVPSLATRVKHRLQIKNPGCVAYDMLFGCPGWIEGVIQANAFIKSGIAKKCLVIGAETLSRVVDSYDRDSMIFSDGAGACIVEDIPEAGTILAHESASFTSEEAYYLYYGKSFNNKAKDNTQYIKMYGRKIYEFGLVNVPLAMKKCLDKSGIPIEQLKKVFIHQANEKMDEAIVKRFFKLYDTPMPDNVMPMNIKELGNSSVATVPTLFDMVKNGKIANQHIEKGDVVIFASVGAGMNINAIVYRC